MHITVAAIGLFGSIFEAAATAIGTGIVVGGFLGASAGMVFGWSRKEVEGHSLRDGYFGAAIAAVLWLFDLLVRYGLSA
jgi:hypothetical protein